MIISKAKVTAFTMLLAFSFKAFAGVGAWTQVGSDSSQFSSLAVDKSGVIYTYSSGKKLQRSADGGATWSTVVQGSDFKTDEISAVAVDPNGVLYVGTVSAGMFKSLDGGANWINISKGISSLVPPAGAKATYATITCISIDEGGIIYIGTYPVTSNNTVDSTTQTAFGGAYKSVDGGITWKTIFAGSTPSGKPDASTQVRAIAVSATGSTFVGNATGFIVNYNTSTGFTAITTLPAYPTVAKFSPSNDIYIGTSVAVFRQLAYSGSGSAPTTPSVLLGSGFDFTFDSAGGVYAGTSTGVMKSSDAGKTWAKFGTGLPSASVFKLVTDPSSTIYAATASGLYQYSTAANTDLLVTGSTTGSPSAINLTANIKVASADVGKSGQVFVVALYQGVALALSSNGFVPLSLPNIQPAATGNLGSSSIQVLSGFDVSQLSGLTIYAGYGTDAVDMVNNGKFKLIYSR